jgi:hypothetical protein
MASWRHGGMAAALGKKSSAIADVSPLRLCTKSHPQLLMCHRCGFAA